jgi:hypothetical protein
MLSWFKAFFAATPKLASNVADLIPTAANGIDKLFYTDQEKAEAGKEAFELWLKLQESTANESSVRGITRRILAFMFCGAFITSFMFVLVALPLNPQYAKEVVSTVDTFGLPWIVGTVVVFYFGPYMVGRMFNKKGEK